MCWAYRRDFRTDVPEQGNEEQRIILVEYYGERIKLARKRIGLTQQQAAERVGVPQQAWQRYESGKCDLKMSTIYNICKALDISADWLMGLQK